ncbi:glycosyltransferase family 9 protein [Azonexus sp.]|jgi:ADP-heptose:LPS heptosyltransferase|uniref:glycosyltransferase family 9 protein n=1 Tax=Azonexus sp. TaxID=1872668 RepID=UPI0028284620|nr:glycosyltransferase family 9 protein [Azonexus sp.]MDR1996643.1 hypothetical protein [Azonexus sp.]
MNQQTTAQPEITAKPRIALVSFDSLGDGLIYLMIANNLQRNGFGVTCYGNVAYQMRAWLPDLDIQPYPPADQFETELAAYDLAIVSPPGFIRANMDATMTARLREKWLLVCQNPPASWRFDHTKRVRHSTTPDKFRQLEKLLDSSGSIARFRPFTDESVVEMTLHYLQEKMHLKEVSKELPIVALEGLLYRRHRNRIIVSPDSAGPEKKDWRPASFLALCHRLQALGYAPEIVVAPKNHAAWAKMAGHTFATPRFDDIGTLAAHLYESGAVIANDSGNGHLASFLGIPVVTIYRKKNPRFHWRPDWAPGIVVCPTFLPFPREKLWKVFVRPSQVIAALERLLEKTA